MIANTHICGLLMDINLCDTHPPRTCLQYIKSKARDRQVVGSHKGSKSDQSAPAAAREAAVLEAPYLQRR